MEASRAAPSSTTVTSLTDAPPLLIKKLGESARTPTRGSAFAAGYDLYACALLLWQYLARMLVADSQ